MMDNEPAEISFEPVSSTSIVTSGMPLREYVSTTFQWALPAGIVLMVIGFWEITVRLFHIAPWLLPPPSSIGAELINSHNLLLRHTWVTLEEVLLGFTLSLVIGISLATAIAYSRIIERTTYPFVIASQTIPVIAIAPLLLIWIGYGIWPKIIVVVLISFFPIVINTVDGLKVADPDMVNMMRTLGASRWQIFTRIQIPSSLPFLFSGIRIAITMSVIGAVIGEWVGASAGLGYLMTRSAPQFLTDRVFASIFILSIMGILLFTLVVLAERFTIPWHQWDKRDKAIRGR